MHRKQFAIFKWSICEWLSAAEIRMRFYLCLCFFYETWIWPGYLLLRNHRLVRGWMPCQVCASHEEEETTRNRPQILTKSWNHLVWCLDFLVVSITNLDVSYSHEYRAPSNTNTSPSDSSGNSSLLSICLECYGIYAILAFYSECLLWLVLYIAL